MNLQINQGSDVPVYLQISDQIGYLIATGELEPGAKLPSLVALARRLRISRKPVEAAYANLVRRGWVESHPGKGAYVRLPAVPAFPVDTPDELVELDELVDRMIRAAVAMKCTREEILDRVRGRLWAPPPDHALIVEEDPVLRGLMHRELSDAVPYPVKAIGPEMLSHSDVLSGAVVACLPGRVWKLQPLLPRTCRLIRLDPAAIAPLTDAMARLPKRSFVLIASVSHYFIEKANSLLSSAALEKRHTLEKRLLVDGATVDLQGPDLVICDTIAFFRIRARKVLPHRFLGEAGISAIRASLEAGSGTTQSG